MQKSKFWFSLLALPGGKPVAFATRRGGEQPRGGTERYLAREGDKGDVKKVGGRVAGAGKVPRHPESGIMTGAGQTFRA